MSDLRSQLSPRARKALAMLSMGQAIPIAEQMQLDIEKHQLGAVDAPRRRQPARRFADTPTGLESELPDRLARYGITLMDNVPSVLKEALQQMLDALEKAGALTPDATSNFSERSSRGDQGELSPKRRQELLSHTNHGRKLLAEEEVERKRARIFAEELNRQGFRR